MNEISESSETVDELGSGSNQADAPTIAVAANARPIGSRARCTMGVANTRQIPGMPITDELADNAPPRCGAMIVELAT